MITKLYSMLGIGKKAGFLVLGETACIHNIKKEKSNLVILSEDASDNTKDRIISLCKNHDTRYYIIGEKKKIGYALGKDLLSIISVTDLKFANAIVDIIDRI